MSIALRTRMTRVAAVAAVSALSACVLSVAPAQAETTDIPVAYGVAGNTVLKKTGSSIKLGPGTLDGTLSISDDANAPVTLKGNLKLPPSNADIKLASGLLRITARVTITPTAPVTGTLANGDLTTRTIANLEINNIKAGFIVPVLPVPTVPSSCKTVRPLDITLVSKNVDIFAPSFPASGTYTIPDFKNCIIANVAVGALISGPGNTINLNLTSRN